MNKDSFAGVWQLLSASSTTLGGERDEAPYGSNPSGLLTYTEDGRVMAMISYGGRKPLPVGGGSFEEQAQAFRSFLAYSGRYTLAGDEVTHRIEISSVTNYVDRDLIRKVRFEDDRMILVTPPTSVNGKSQTVELIWRRL